MAHHHENGKWYADTAFLNNVSGIIPGARLEHMGFGEFYLSTPKGRIDFDRMRGKDFPGQSGRSHWMTDDQGGKLVEEVIEAMERKGKSDRLATNLLHIAARLPQGDPVRRKLLVALRRESRGDITQFDIDEIAEMVDINDHSGAVLHLADLMGDRKMREVMLLVMKIADVLKYTPHPLVEFRHQIQKELLDKAKKRLDRDMYQKLYMAF